jgi:serine/threonine-protein kinase
MMPQAQAASKVADLKNERHEELVIDGVEVPDEVDPEASVQQPDYNDLPTPPALQELESSSEAPHFNEPETFAKSEGISDEDRTRGSLDEPQRFEPDTATEKDGPATPFFGSTEPEPVSTSTENFSDDHSQEYPVPDQHTDAEIPPVKLDHVPEPVDLQKESVPVEPSSESFSATEPVIAKPAEMLDVPEKSAEPSKFDSVRIIDDRFTPTGTRPAVESETKAEPQDQDSARIAKSHTASGMGTVDTGGRRSAKLKPLEEGLVLNGRYEIVRKIGGGGMGAVYLASDNNLGGVLRAVKEMVQAHIEEEQQSKAIEDFKRESMILSRLDHPSIPTIYDYFLDEMEGRFYLVMKYISGGDLSARLRAAPEGKIDEKTVTEWGIQVADVLDYLHSQPTTIVYRDLKPSNIMIDGNTGRVMLIDFGIARSINQKEEKGVTAVGTMGYAPPELFSGNVEPRSDIYSLGSTMFHLLTGADPQSNPLLIFDFQKNPRPRQINPQLSDQIELFLMRAVEYSASARFESAAEVRALLTEHLANLNKGAVSYGVKEVPESVSLANQPVFCGFCGQRIVATDLFCAFCGAKQPIAQKGVHSEIYGRGAVTARLLVEGTSELQSPVFSLDKTEILIGRRDPMSNIFPEVDLSKYDPQTKISRRHARIWREGNSFLVEDLGSSNGTVLVPIVHDSFRLSPRQPHALSNGDKIRVGDTTLHFVVN